LPIAINIFSSSSSRTVTAYDVVSVSILLYVITNLKFVYCHTLNCCVRCLICVMLCEYITGAQIPDVCYPGRLNFVQWRLTFKKKRRFFSLHTKKCISSHELRRKRQITMSVSPQSGIRFQVILLTLKSLAMDPRFLGNFQTLGLCQNREMRVYRLCTFGVMAVVISDYIAPKAEDKVNNDVNQNLSALFNDAVK